MKSLVRILCWCLLCTPLVYAAPDSSSPLVRSLKGKIVFLRGMESGNKLAFDAKGQFVGNVQTSPFAYSALLVDKVHESSAGLEISGERVALLFAATPQSISASDFHYVRLGESVKITIAGGSSTTAEMDAAINNVFAFTAQGDLLGRPIPDVQAAYATLGLKVAAGKVLELGAPTEAPGNGAVQLPRAAQMDGVEPPRLIYSVPPSRGHGTHADGKGTCVISLMVNTNGIPVNIHVARSANPDLDEDAIEAVKQYRFLPALHDGRPVPAQINVEMNFR